MRERRKIITDRNIKLLRVFAAFALIFATTHVAQAQQSADPSQIQRRIEQTKPKYPKADPKIGVPAAPDVAPEKEGAERFVLAAVVVEGATVYDPVTFAPFYQDLLAREVTLTDVEKILAKITKTYRDDGYILSRAIAPPQDLAAGVLRIDVIEGYVDAIEFKGDDGKGALFETYVGRIKADRPLRLKTLERNVLLMNDISGFKIDPRLRPLDEESGRYTLVMNTDYSLIDGQAYLNNRGEPSAGRLQSWLSAGLNSGLGLRERFQVGFFTVPTEPEELLYFEGQYTQPIGSDGFHASLLASASVLDSGSELEATDIESGSSRVQLRAWYPIIRSSKQNLWLNGVLHYQDFRETSFDRTVTADRLRVARLRMNYWLSHHKGSTSVSLEASQGFNVLDATERGEEPNLSRFDGRSDFTKATAYVSRTQGIGSNFGLQVSANGQWSAQPLLSSEEFAVGGTSFGRGYDFSEITGDMGVAGAVEFRYGKNVGEKWLSAFQLYTFYDIGAVWNEFNGTGKVRNSISSTGVGTRITVTPNLKIDLEAAKPLTRFVDTRDNTKMRYFFNISASF